MSKSASTRVTNNANVDLSVAVWLAHDEYDYQPQIKNYFSVTTLIKPIRQTILASRLTPEQRTPDISDVIQSVVGRTLHTGVEVAWKQHYRTSLAKLGYPQRVIDAIRINPEQEEPDTIPVYTEIRTNKEIAGYVVGGQIDLIIEGRLRDLKKTTVWGYQNQKSVDSWMLQGSMYRWLNPDKVTHDELLVQYLLLDWQRSGTKRDANYPATAVPTRLIRLMSVQETEQWVRNRLRLLTQYWDAPEKELPECTEEELWRSPPVYKYYLDANAPPGKRSTKNFDNEHDALQFKAQEKGGRGRIDRKPGEVKACLYCAGFPLCTQKDRLISDGSLLLQAEPEE